MEKDYYTTTEAAKILSVSADTVLKWVRAGKIDSYRTPGGHARIPRDAVARLLPNAEEALPDKMAHRLERAFDASESRDSVFSYCWDYYAVGDELLDECRNCIAYKSRAHRCYEMRDLPEHFGPLKINCKTSCMECDFYRIAQHKKLSALVISNSADLVETLKKENGGLDLELAFAANEYETACAVETCRPDYVVVDCAFGVSRTRELCRNLAQDDRLPVVRIILSSKLAQQKDYCDYEAFGWIKRPFTRSQLRDLIRGVGAG